MSSRRENIQVPRGHRQSKRCGHREDAQRDLSLSAKRIMFSDRQSRDEHYRIPKDYRGSKRGRLSQDGPKDQSISVKKTRYPNRQSRDEHYRIPKDYRGSKRGRLSQDGPKDQSISVKKTRYPNRKSRDEHYRISRDYRGSKRGRLSQDGPKDQAISVKKTRYPNRKSRDEHYRISRDYRGSKRVRLSQDAQKDLSVYVRRSWSPDGNISPTMIPLRDFSITIEDLITNKGTLPEHDEFKLYLQRIQLNEFFVAHKEEEWFKNKYHPDDSAKEKEKRAIALEKRLEVFKEFLANGKIDSVSVDAENQGPVIRLLDSVIIKLEGGTDFDLTVLNSTNTLKIQGVPENEKNNAGKNSDGVMDSNKKDDNKTNKKDKSVFNKSGDADVDVQKQEIFNITNNNNQNSDLKPRALHHTTSICLRNLAPTIMKSELETICKNYTGFKRIAMGDPDPKSEHHWTRKGWVTFDGDVKINEIFWDLKLVQVNGSYLNVYDIIKYPRSRIQSVNGITNHFQVARNDMKLCVSIINHFDNRSGLWQSIDGEQPAMELTYCVVSRNPVLHNIIDFVVDEASPEEEERIGECVPFEPEVNTKKHRQLLKALDRMILYLRIVHSVDFYNYKQYANEDDMPSRCGVIHARSALTRFPCTQQEINDYCHYSQIKTNYLIVSTYEATEQELIQLGAKDEEQEIKRFITSNTQEISKDKWLCHLSGKKFKSPEFVFKHITNNYNDLLDDVKKEVKYFNNYLRDLNRPQQLAQSCPAPNP